jgi:hypothetical protein
MAVIAAALVECLDSAVELRPLLKGVYTYGQPLVGNAELAQHIEARLGNRLFRHIYDQDIVPRLPPRSTGKSTHFGKEYRAKRNDRYVETRDKRAWVEQAPSALISIPIGMLAWICQQFPFAMKYSLPYSWDDHSPVHYLKGFYALPETRN